jgi:hypothetical protein
MERGATRLPSSPSHAASSQPRGMGHLLSGPSIDERLSKRLRAEGGPPSGLP